MSPSLIEFLQHIESELRYIDKKTAVLSFDEFLDDETLTKAIVRSFEIAGEACKRVPDEIRTKYPLFDWRGFAGLRDRMIHHYWGIDYYII
ncbi:HepT-like ribonuclease domain-containing protein, partial [Dyadobacter crusticola]|uniref:HepT-like ribonuclease domain-containing protein n=1 Tax=Dyadobacter crusticola TaxID=292407 RepID=UPI0004E14756